MRKSKSRTKKAPKRVLALPDLEHAKTAVLNSLSSASGQQTYEHAIREFVAWYCSEPRLAFNRTVVLRYRIHLEQRGYAPATINLRLAAVRRIAYEAADAGLLYAGRACDDPQGAITQQREAACRREDPMVDRRDRGGSGVIGRPEGRRRRSTPDARRAPSRHHAWESRNLCHAKAERQMGGGQLYERGASSKAVDVIAF